MLLIKMKKITLFIALAIFVNAVYMKANRHVGDDYKMIVAHFVNKQADLSILNLLEMGDGIKQRCPDIRNQLNVTMLEVQKCTEKIKLGSSTLCTIIKTNIIPCSRPIRDLITSCMPAESKDLPLLIEKIIAAIIDKACNSTLEEMLESINPCQFEKDLLGFSSCSELNTAIVSSGNKLPSKNFVCSLLPKVRTCFKEVHNASCSNPITRTVFVNFHQVIMDSTKEICNTPSKNELA